MNRYIVRIECPPKSGGCDVTMVDDPEGQWVRYEDQAKAAADYCNDLAHHCSKIAEKDNKITVLTDQLASACRVSDSRGKKINDLCHSNHRLQEVSDNLVALARQIKASVNTMRELKPADNSCPPSFDQLTEEVRVLSNQQDCDRKWFNARIDDLVKRID